MKEMNPLVSVVLVTYQQEAYIAQAIDSVLNQQVGFDYEIIIGEDLGGDHTRDICLHYSTKYEHIHVLRRDRNMGVAANWCDCVKHARGMYIMMLDGDDYWHNPNKMQMQVDYMESHHECVVCHTEVDVLKMYKRHIIHNRNKTAGINVPEGWILEDVLQGNDKVTSSSACLRAESVIKYIPFSLYETEQFPCEDWPTLVILAAHGTFHYIPISTTTYRIAANSITHVKNYDAIRDYWRRSDHMRECLYRLFPDWGEYKDHLYFETQVNNSLLNAAYDNNDRQSACHFAKENPSSRLANLCTKTILTFQLYRLYRHLKH